ncbi:MAG TPA: lactate utilization protein [Desulfuromonadales bacterium]|nr:lactate utilization protein [Desulfuromonadales bacterium]
MLSGFIEALQKVGGQAREIETVQQAAAYIADRVKGSVLLPEQSSLDRAGLAKALDAAGLEVIRNGWRERSADAEGGVTGVNFALADTGTLVLDSTEEALRLTTTLPEKHFALLDPGKLVADSLAAVPYLRDFHARSPRNYLAYITGPSRTADIERVLTIGVHGPRELHVLLLPGLSDDFFEI